MNMSFHEVVELVAEFGAWLDGRGTAAARAESLEAGLRVYRSERSREAGLKAAQAAFTDANQPLHVVSSTGASRVVN